MWLSAVGGVLAGDLTLVCGPCSRYQGLPDVGVRTHLGLDRPIHDGSIVRVQLEHLAGHPALEEVTILRDLPAMTSKKLSLTIPSSTLALLNRADRRRWHARVVALFWDRRWQWPSTGMVSRRTRGSRYCPGLQGAVRGRTFKTTIPDGGAARLRLPVGHHAHSLWPGC